MYKSTLWDGKEEVAVKEIIFKGEGMKEGTHRELIPQARIKREVLLMAVVGMLSETEEETNLIGFRGFWLEEYSVFMVMELGYANVKELLRQSRRAREAGSSSSGGRVLGVSEKVSIGAQVARALVYLHSVGMVHRDLKSENILVVSRLEDGKIRVKLTDFGISRVTSSSSTVVSGTLSWAAPELVDPKNWGRGRKVQILPSSDVYSFGYLLWALLTEQEPHAGLLSNQDAIKKQLRRHAECPLPVPSDSFWEKEDVEKGREMRDMMLECWRSDPQKRPTMSHIQSRLEAML